MIVSAEALTSANFERLSQAEATIEHLNKENATLLDRLDDLENRSRRSNLRIRNEEGQDSTQFISNMLVEAMGQNAFVKPLKQIGRAHV